MRSDETQREGGDLCGGSNREKSAQMCQEKIRSRHIQTIRSVNQSAASITRIKLEFINIEVNSNLSNQSKSKVTTSPSSHHLPVVTAHRW